MISSLMVSNRGEIARRVFRTCRDLGIATVAVYSDADADAPHVREADTAVRLPGSAAADTYLRGELLVRAALDAGADAVHPGYGFLSENAEFAQRVLDAGLTWIGPPPRAIADMGSKTRAKTLMAASGVPVLGAVDPDAATAADLPLLVKAAAGGGGRGMRIVRALSDLPAALAAARAEAASAFGSDEVFCEPYLETGRHVEVQVLADTHGTVWTLGERDCSLQRRHQKVIEESPAPGLADDTRRRMAEAAAAAARAIGYAGAGTVEFLLGADGRFFFLEMNTRLQVEHPVTECVTGLDLVALQLRIAEGAALTGEPPAPRGHAIEARLYAEDPARDWRPQTGTIHRFDFPGETTTFAPVTFATGPAESGLRIDSGVDDGTVVGADYDAMLAKAVAWAPTRTAAARRLADALARARIHGVDTNRDLLVRALRHPEFLSGAVDTDFLARHRDALLTESKDGLPALGAVAAALADAAARRGTGPLPRDLPSGWRNLPAQPQVKRFQTTDGTQYEVRYRFGRDGLELEGLPGVRLISSAPDRVVLESDGVRRTFDVSVYAAADTVWVDTPGLHAAYRPISRFPEPTEHVAPGSLLAPMPGTVVRIAFGEGDPVAAGRPLLWLEAMKMEHEVASPTDGVLAELRVRPGQQVEVGAVLAVVEPHPAAPSADSAGTDEAATTGSKGLTS
ncbi:MAG TPA: biotin carboxylase N-terminal domain-containing protein [Actinocrinis sp.]|jgi:propionyl-CoA carboxylase alpha chain|uniref:acetyl/propionyl/methylcrotonyl-CoA carboxylase subunit alpha n=1 Tax=Actinocrinis sp. TaxID=1920516 RepID=UPI002DDDAAC9|nr:biotin carboxylase N-terminal domain-containing protein [Actinocrinis sp.]HEV3172888.1 biotin carboxylase N-terminal domain-containing protein [Actinocrinis sp.]